MPDLVLQIATGTDDASQKADDSNFSHASTNLTVQASATASTRGNCGFRFDNVPIPVGAVITSARLEPYINSSAADDPECDIFFEDADDPGDFNGDDVNTRTQTSASVSHSDADVGVGFDVGWPDISTPLQEVIDRVGWAALNALVVLVYGKSSTEANCRVNAYDGTAGNAAKLYITWEIVSDPAVLTVTAVDGALSFAYTILRPDPVVLSITAVDGTLSVDVAITAEPAVLNIIAVDGTLLGAQFASLPCPAPPIAIDEQHPMESTDIDDGAVQAARANRKITRVIDLPYPDLTDEMLTELEAAWNAGEGLVTPFEFTVPGEGSASLVIFAERMLEIAHNAANARSSVVRLVDVTPPEAP